MEDIFDNKRRKDESFSDYKLRLKENKKEQKKVSSPKMYWPSGIAKTFTQERAAEMARRILEKEGKITEAEDIEYERDTA